MSRLVILPMRYGLLPALRSTRFSLSTFRLCRKNVLRITQQRIIPQKLSKLLHHPLRPGRRSNQMSIPLGLPAPLLHPALDFRKPIILYIAPQIPQKRLQGLLTLFGRRLIFRSSMLPKDDIIHYAIVPAGAQFRSRKRSKRLFVTDGKIWEPK